MDVATVFDHARLRAGLVKKEQKMSVFDLVKKLVILGRQNRQGQFAGWWTAGLRLGLHNWQYFCHGESQRRTEDSAQNSSAGSYVIFHTLLFPLAPNVTNLDQSMLSIQRPHCTTVPVLG